MSVQASEFINRFMLNILKKWTATERTNEPQHKLVRLKSEYYSQVNAYANRGQIMTERVAHVVTPGLALLTVADHLNGSACPS